MHASRRALQNAAICAARLRLGAGLGSAILLALLCVSAVRAQSSGGSSGGQGQSQGNPRPYYSPPQDLSDVSGDSMDPLMVARRIRALNIQRQKQMLADADKLLKLAQELNDEVAKANSGVLTPDELRKVADIEKLARDVRQKMTDEAGALPPILMPPAPMLYPIH